MRAPLHLDIASPFTGTRAHGNDLTGETPIVVLPTVVIAEAGAPATAVAAAAAVPAAAHVAVRPEVVPGAGAGHADPSGPRRSFLVARYHQLPAADLVETLDELRAIWPAGSERPATVADAIAVLTDELLTRYQARTA
jgi:hypothetical protein